ncbi:MBL fold metallo-hydrolase [Saccharibacillus deserti]|uniref:MBL fold metallo-hydrolase n=1 Tax=Saccharibacillus deserti TaxID=1634444 RepID=UPI0015566C1D|nr:MBL fold metallo-hydrolase [Saccharibacillus deserti]
MMKLQVWGGAGEHGRSCYRLVGERRRLLLDCGVKKEDRGLYPLLNPSEIPDLTSVFLSHAHEDHAMALPLLYKHGYEGAIWTTRATAGQLHKGFDSWGHFVASRGGTLPYGPEHIKAMRFLYLEDCAPPCRWFEWAPSPGEEPIRIMWGRTGHLSGSIWLRLQTEGRHIFFSGDYTRESILLEADSPAVSEENGNVPIADLSIVDNAYGTDDEAQEIKLERIRSEIRSVLENGGRVLLPVPAFGRSQDLLIWAFQSLAPYRVVVERTIWQGLLYLIDDPLWLRPGVAAQIRTLTQECSPRLILVDNEAERSEALRREGPCLILTADGMLESAVSQAYVEHLAPDSDNLILLTGHASRGTRARMLLDNRLPDVRCRVMHQFYKVHQGIGDVRLMLEEAPAAAVVLVHAPDVSTREVCRILQSEGRDGLFPLTPGMEIVI